MRLYSICSHTDDVRSSDIHITIGWCLRCQRRLSEFKNIRDINKIQNLQGYFHSGAMSERPITRPFMISTDDNQRNIFDFAKGWHKSLLKAYNDALVIDDEDFSSEISSDDDDSSSETPNDDEKSSSEICIHREETRKYLMIAATIQRTIEWTENKVLCEYGIDNVFIRCKGSDGFNGPCTTCKSVPLMLRFGALMGAVSSVVLLLLCGMLGVSWGWIVGVLLLLSLWAGFHVLNQDID